MCDNSRGLLISDHISKVFTTLLKDAIDKPYSEWVDRMQCGCAKKRGTDTANHFVRSFLDAAKLKGLSVFVLFLDLTKAIAFVLRELLMGWQQGFHKDPIKFFTDLGLTEDEARDRAQEIDCYGSLLEELGVDPKVVALIASLHTGSWFQYKDLDTVILSIKGGRQGCKLGSIVFNMVYARALYSVRYKLKKQGIGLVVRLNDSSADANKPVFAWSNRDEKNVDAV